MVQLQFPQDTTPHSSQAPSFKNTKNGWDLLESHHHNPLIDFDIRVTIRERLTNGDMRVFRVGLYPVAGDIVVGNELVAICKVAYGRRRAELLKREADLYRGKLAPLQGKWVPIFYGCYLGQTVEAWTCIVIMQDCGKPLPCPLTMLPPQSRAQVIDGLHHIHKAGIVHGDFYERNVVIRQRENGKLWLTIIDFGEAKEHDCPCKDWKVVLYDLKPLPSEFRCDELWNACVDVVDIWRPRTIRWYDDFVPADWAATGTAEEFIEKAGVPKGIKREDALRWANDVIGRYRRARWMRKDWDELPVPWKDENSGVGSGV